MLCLREASLGPVFGVKGGAAGGGYAQIVPMEKFLNIVCRVGGLSPSAVVLVATVKALKHHGGDPDGGLAALEHGAFAAELSEGVSRGGEGAVALAEAVVAASEQASRLEHTYPLDAPIDAKIEAIARKVYGAAGVVFLPAAREKLERWRDSELARLPVCMAKTHISLSDDPTLLNATDRLRCPHPRPAPLHGRRLARRALRRDADDAGPRREPRGVRDRHRRGWTHRRALLISRRCRSRQARRARPRSSSAPTSAARARRTGTRSGRISPRSVPQRPRRAARSPRC